VSKWVKGSYVPTLDYCHMLATVLGVRPAWLAFEDGGAGIESESDRQKRDFLEEQARKYPPAETPQASPKKGRRAG